MQRISRGLQTVLLLAPVLWLLSSCSDTVLEVPIAKLVAEPERFHGHVVVITGQVRSFDEPRHYWLEDDAHRRVGIHPETLVQDLVGQQVRVRGRFTASPTEGRRIQVHQLIRLPEQSE